MADYKETKASAQISDTRKYLSRANTINIQGVKNQSFSKSDAREVEANISLAERSLKSLSNTYRSMQREAALLTKTLDSIGRDSSGAEDLIVAYDKLTKSMDKAKGMAGYLNAALRQTRAETRQNANNTPQGSMFKTFMSTGADAGRSFASNAGIPGMGVMGSNPWVAGAAIAGMVVNKAVQTSLRVAAANDPLRQRGFNMDALVSTGQGMGMYGEKTAALVSAYGQSGGNLGVMGYNRLASFSRGYGMEAGETGQRFGSMAGMLSIGNREGNRLPDIIASAFAKGIREADLPNFLDSLQTTLGQLNQTLPSISEAQIATLTSIQKGMYNLGGGALSVDAAGRATRGLTTGMANPRSKTMGMLSLMTVGGVTGGTLADYIEQGDLKGDNKRIAKEYATSNSPQQRLQGLEMALGDPGTALKILQKNMKTWNEVGGEYGKGMMVQILKENTNMGTGEIALLIEKLKLGTPVGDEEVKKMLAKAGDFGPKTLDEKYKEEASRVTGLADRIGTAIEKALIPAGDALIRFAGVVLGITPKTPEEGAYADLLAGNGGPRSRHKILNDNPLVTMDERKAAMQMGSFENLSSLAKRGMKATKVYDSTAEAMEKLDNNLADKTGYEAIVRALMKMFEQGQYGGDINKYVKIEVEAKDVPSQNMIYKAKNDPHPRSKHN